MLRLNLAEAKVGEIVGNYIHPVNQPEGMISELKAHLVACVRQAIEDGEIIDPENSRQWLEELHHRLPNGSRD